MESLTIEAEQEILRKRVDEHLRAADDLDKRIIDLERAKSRVDDEEWNFVLDALKDQIEREQKKLVNNPYATIKFREGQLEFYAHKARMTRTELLTFIEEELVGGPVQVV
jgi:hypothetical protein